MGFPSVIIASIIMGIMMLAANTQSTLLVDLQRERVQKSHMMDIKRTLLESYEDTGVVTTALTTLDGYSSLDYSLLKDLGDSSFIILDNGGTPFSYNGSTATYKAVIVTPYQDGLDSTIATNVLTINNSEAFVLVSQSDLDRTLRGQTKAKITACNSAITNYVANVGSNPLSPLDLVAGGYIEANKIIDDFGNNMVFDATPICYSIGRNGIDDSKGSDDIF